MFRKFASLLSSSRCKRTSTLFGSTVRPQLEALEDRTVPSILVDTLVDEVSNPATTSLREAIGQAAANPGDDTITFAAKLSGTIKLELGALLLNDSTGEVSIDGGTGGITIKGDDTPIPPPAPPGIFPPILVNFPGNTASLTGLTLTGAGNSAIINQGMLSLTDTTVSDNTSGAVAGGIFNFGTMTLTGSTVSGNSGGSIFGGGGGIINIGTMMLTDSTVSDNSSTGSGGGIRNSGTLTLTDSTVSGNSAASSGGGIVNVGGSLMLTDSTVSDNAAVRDGGGIWNTASMTLTGSTVRRNSAGQDGGGIFNNGSGVQVIDSAFLQNSAGRDGGGIFNTSLANLTLTDVHLAHNVAGRNGGGLYNAGSASIASSIFSGNKAAKKTGLGTAIYVATTGILDLDDETVISQNGVPIFQEP